MRSGTLGRGGRGDEVMAGEGFGVGPVEGAAGVFGVRVEVWAGWRVVLLVRWRRDEGRKGKGMRLVVMLGIPVMGWVKRGLTYTESGDDRSETTRTSQSQATRTVLG